MCEQTSKLLIQPETPDKPGSAVQGAFAGKPLDGSQYIDVVEEQEYADRRPTPEEQKPRHSFLHSPKKTSGQ